MPNIFVKVPENVFDAGSRDSLSKSINAAAVRCERIASHPKSKSLCWVMIEEISAGHWTCGGIDVTPQIIPVCITINVPAGVLDDDSRAEYVDLVHRAVADALPRDTRKIVTSCIVNEIPDGTWAANGVIWRLPQFAAAAGFEHLRHLAASG